jgi:small-conductance mechanosensitive channel
VFWTWLEAFQATWWARNLAESFLLNLLGWLLRRGLSHRVGRLRLEPDDRLRWLVAGRNAVILLVGLGLVVVWAQQIHEVLLSVVALAAAVVIATKELILCLSGATYQTFSRSFQVGDRIEVAGWRGDVIDQGPFATTLLEVGPGQSVNQASGRTVVIPNSLFLTHAIVNESFSDQYVLHPFSVPLRRTEDWRRAEQQILAAATEVCGPWIAQAKSFLGAKLDRFSLTPVSAEPRVQLRLTSPDTIELLVRVPCPARQKGKVEQAILRKYLDNDTH